MKEEAQSKKLPPKISIGCGATANNSQQSTPTKAHNDELYQSMLRINNLGSLSISSIKDESLDIDLSACVTISDPSVLINSNQSLSSTDFWRLLDESAQNSQLDVALNSSNEDVAQAANSTTNSSSNSMLDMIKEERELAEISADIKNVTETSFSGTFLRPEPPSANMLVSPFKKNTKAAQSAEAQQLQVRKLKIPTTSASLHAIANGNTNGINGNNIKCSNSNAKKCKGTSILENNSKVAKICNMKSNVVATNAAKHVATATAMQTAKVAGCLQSESAADLEEQQQQLQQQQQQLKEFPILYKCLECNVVQRDPLEFPIQHTNTHRVHFKCSECERDFEQEAGLKKHVKTHRPADARKDAWKKCPDCGKCLKLGSMWMHRKIHSDYKKYCCDVCGQKFVQKINLTHHSRVHTAEKPFECPECQKRFQERSHLLRHQKYHAQTRSYRCDKCGKMYKTERCLKVHNLVHLEQRPFACNVCNKSFISNSKLKQHSNIHTGERPFKCNYCPRDFTNFPNWLKHTRRRHKVDHKTGEQLENIPSYCSKKSNKTAKQTTAAAAAVTTTTTTTSANNATTVKVATVAAATTTTAPVAKAQLKRKKKTTTLATNANAALTTPAEPITIVAATKMDVTTSSISSQKPKRERKQAAPKQVQKQQQQQRERQRNLPQIMHEIKKEPMEHNNKTVGSNNNNMIIHSVHSFPDLHCLSLTSAEELIMEQALEMEESGLYDAGNACTTGTDNAISSEAAAAFHFKIKSEFNLDCVKKEQIENLPSKLCSSLESSPYSSPASVEQLIVTTNPMTKTAAAAAAATTNSFFMPATGTLVTLANPIAANAFGSINSIAGASALYLPMALSMPLLMPTSQQMLPSVDTLLTTQVNASTAAAVFNGKTTMSLPQRNLS